MHLWQKEPDSLLLIVFEIKQLPANFFIVQPFVFLMILSGFELDSRMRFQIVIGTHVVFSQQLINCFATLATKGFFLYPNGIIRALVAAMVAGVGVRIRSAHVIG